MRERLRSLRGENKARQGRDTWVTVATAPDQLTAELWREMLTSEAIPATLAPADAVTFLGVSTSPCRVLVPAEWLGAAEAVLRGEAWKQQDQEA